MRRKLGLTIFLRFSIVLACLSLASHGSVQEGRPLTVENLIYLLENKAKEENIINQIQRYKVDFALNNQRVQALIRAGATGNMLNAIENHRFADLFFTFPKKDAVLSHNIMVYGWSKVIPDRHLWLFVRAKGASDWMPQAEEVLLDADGEWSHEVFIGKKNESRAVFEIRAVWVDLEAHRKLEAYFNAPCGKTRYPDDCPGRDIPLGTLTAQVAVFRG